MTNWRPEKASGRFTRDHKNRFRRSCRSVRLQRAPLTRRHTPHSFFTQPGPEAASAVARLGTAAIRGTADQHGFEHSRYVRRVGYLCPDNASRPHWITCKRYGRAGRPEQDRSWSGRARPPTAATWGFERAGRFDCKGLGGAARHRVEAADFNSEKGDYRK
jgi:hypothetical protein